MATWKSERRASWIEGTPEGKALGESSMAFSGTAEENWV